MVVVFGPVEFQMGSPTTEAGRGGGPEDKTEQQHKNRINRSFAIAAWEVTVTQFLQFRTTQRCQKGFSPSGNYPINQVNWFDAAAYCNWLSMKEGLPRDQWCYQPNKDEAYAEGMKMADDYLKRTGYRLPTEAEWEYACRAGAETSRFYGEREDLLGQYAWYGKSTGDTMAPVGSQKPNDLGLFDMHGNAMEWVQDVAAFYQVAQPALDKEDRANLHVSVKAPRLLRGGSFADQALSVRSAVRIIHVPSYPIVDGGFRVARTIR